MWPQWNVSIAKVKKKKKVKLVSLTLVNSSMTSKSKDASINAEKKSKVNQDRKVVALRSKMLG
jgi:hypothetical protein